MIRVNGREFDEHGLRAKSEARKRAGLYNPHLLSLLERDILEEVKEHVFSMIQVVYDMQRVLEDKGCRLEPSPDLSTGEPGEKKSRPRSFLRRVQTRFIRAVCEGYVQQQEKFNTFLTKAVDISYRQLCGAGGGIALSEVAERRDLWLSRRPQWDGETARALSCEGRSDAVVVGIPGTDFLELLHDEKRLLMAVDNDDASAAEAQSLFLPAWFHPRPLEVLEHLAPEDLGLFVVAFPECLTGDELEGLFEWAGSHAGKGGTAVIAINRGWSDPLSGDDGFVRYWPRRFLEKLLRRHGFRTVEWKAGERAFLRGEMGT